MADFSVFQFSRQDGVFSIDGSTLWHGQFFLMQTICHGSILPAAISLEI
jgi:hypothetical protein